METMNPMKVKRDKIEAVIYTQHHRVEGEVYTQPNSRLIDFLNGRVDQSFIAVTKARIYNLSGEQPIHMVDFLTINKSIIAMIIPMSSLK